MASGLRQRGQVVDELGSCAQAEAPVAGPLARPQPETSGGHLDRARRRCQRIDALDIGAADYQRPPRGAPSRARGGFQCTISTGAVMDSSTVRVAPPSTNSRARLCP